MRAAPLPVTLVVEDLLDNYSFKSLASLTSHIETLVLDNFYVFRGDEAFIPHNLREDPFFPKMKLPGLNEVKIIGHDLPSEYIFECFSAICNRKLPSISLYLTCRDNIRLEKLVNHPICRSIHTMDIASGESGNYSV
jgi:hypothetical protein